MTTRDYKAFVWALSEMPNDKAKDALKKEYQRMKGEGASMDRIVSQMASTVMDGLEYGTWIGLNADECWEVRKQRKASGT